MYSTCLFCNANLGSNEVIKHCLVGRRLAFDPRKGRLWVVCTHCQRWNLTPIEERFEAVEECERAFRGTIVRTSTDNIGLAVLSSGLDLVRIGEPLRPELAAWRYADNFLHRRTRSYLVKGASVAGTGALSVGVGATIYGVLSVPATAYAGYAGAVPYFLTAVAALPAIGVLAAQDYIKNDRVVARLTKLRRVITVRARHARGAEITFDHEGAANLTVPHDAGRITLDGTEAIHATTIILANSNPFGGDKNLVQNAVHQIEEAGTVEGFLERASRRGAQRRGRMLGTLGGYRGLGAMNLSLTERLALEMAVHEESERRAMEGELAVLEEAWRDAEEIAEICDGPLTTPTLGEWLRSRR